MGMQSTSMQTPYSSAQQGKGQGLPNPEAQMSPNQPPMDPREEMMRRFPQAATGGGFNVEPVSQDMQNQFPASASASGGQMIGAQGTPQDAMGQMPQGKGQGAQGAITFPGQGGQPMMGQPNAYPNTINPSDNTGMAQKQPMSSGKGGGSAKGAR
jgi:hypothetical protein